MGLREPRAAPAAGALVDVAWLAAQHGSDVVVFEVDSDSSSFYRDHLPGALPLDWYDDLHGRGSRGPVSCEQFEQLMRRNGVREDTHVVVAGASDTAFATHAYWLLRYYRHARVSLLDGGRPAWTRAGLSLEDSDPSPGPSTTYRSPGPDTSIRVARDELLARYVGAPPPALLLDCRTSPEYEGRPHHPMDLPVERHRVSGHIPGAVNLPSGSLLDEVQRFRPLSELQSVAAERGLTADADVVVYCRVAERSSLLWFALHELLGHPRVRHYDGGWAEYGSLIDVPVARDDDGS